jgi:hydrogenase-4 component D
MGPATYGWQFYALLLLIIPLAGALLASACRRREADLVAILTVAAALVVGLLLLSLFLAVPVGEKLEATWPLLPWLQPLPGSRALPGALGFLVDSLSMLMLLVVLLVGAAVVLFSVDYLSPSNREHPLADGKGRYYWWLLLFILAMVGLALSPNFLQLFIFWELTTICSWALISFYENPRSLAAGMKALILTGLGGLAFVIALLLIYHPTHSFAYDALGLLSDRCRAGVFLLLLVAAWAKAAQVPFWTWLPDAMEAPTPVSAYLHAAAMVKAGLFLMARTVFGSYAALTHLNATYNLGLARVQVTSVDLGIFMAAAATVTMLVGLYFYFLQDDLKRLLAYSTITHLGYVLFGLGLAVAGAWIGLQAALLHIMTHAMAKTILFLAAGAIAWGTGTRSIAALSGLAQRMPVTAFAFWTGTFALAGIPPLATFWSKFFLFAAAIKLAGFWGLLLLLAFVVEVILALLWFLRVGQKVFFGAPSAAAAQAQEGSFIMLAVLLVLALLCLLAPLLAWPLLPAAPAS